MGGLRTLWVIFSVVTFVRSQTVIPDSDYYNEDVEDYELRMSDSDVLAICPDDVCPTGDLEKLKQASGVKVKGRFKLRVDYKSKPYSCRCDKYCIKYNDCCIGLIVNGTDEAKASVLQHHPWRCNFLEIHEPKAVWALMMSKCPQDSPDLETNRLCEGVNIELPRRQKYLVDVPIYSNRTKVLYKNVYCARCHNEQGSDILKHTLRLNCDQEFTPQERALFQHRAEYIFGKRIWKYENSTCYLSVEQFSKENLERNIPGIRYCGPDMIQSCPANSNVSEKTEALCTGYTQALTLNLPPEDQFSKFGSQTFFKNPHCYLCHHGIEEVPEKPFQFPCYQHITMTRYGPSRDQPVEGAGLNFLFDFNVFNENQWVGYEMLCKEDEVWDYVRHDCHPMVCGKGHRLKDGECESVAPSGESKDDDDPNDHEPKRDLAEEPDCYRIVLHESEYSFLEDQNDTLVVNLTTGGSVHLPPSEYEIWNDTAVTICAKFLHRAFESRFSPIFNYLSVALVGLSVCFLFLHILLYILLPKLRNLPSNNLFCLTLSLFLSQLILLIFITETENRELCIAAAILIHYFFLSAFFWMCAMSFDISRTFSGQMLLQGRRGRRGGRGSFVKYSVFSWGGPFIIVSLAVITDFGGLDFDFLQSIKPGYGQTGLCWISHRMSLLVFFALPVGLVILSNLILFSLTARAILIQNRESSRVLGGGAKDSTKSGKNNDEALLKLYVKLALIMGLTWILGFISAFLLWDWVWYAFVVLNGLQGTFIFFAFDWKRRTLGLLKDRLGLKSSKENSTLTGSLGVGRSDLGGRKALATSTSITSLGNHATINSGMISGQELKKSSDSVAST